MKMKTKIGMFCVAGLLLASCTGQEVWQQGEEVIRLDAGTHADTRSADGLGYLSSLGTQVGIYGAATKKTDAGSLPGSDWTESPLMPNVQTTGVDKTTGAISWADSYNYPQESGQYVKFCAYHPYAAVGAQGANYVSVAAGRAPQLHFTLTGAEDVMVADPVLGSRVQLPAALNFNHVLTQFSFQLVNADGFFSKSVKSIAFKRVNTCSVVNLETGALGEWTTPKDDIGVADFDTPQPITGTKDAPQKVGREVMLQPGLEKCVLVIVFDNGDESQVTLKPQGDTTFEAGKSYLITLKFSGKVVFQARASVTPWGAGAWGGSTLD